MFSTTWRQSATDAIKFWEPRRILYNLALVIVVLVCFWVEYPASKKSLQLDMGLLIFMLAVMANVVYCAAYPVDIFVQASGYQELWRKYRWMLFVLGTAFAGVITRFWAIGLFGSGG
jgi:hypothetical protein